MKRPFRVNDRVTITGLVQTNKEACRGRVVCSNRKSRYNQGVVVLCDIGDQEIIECFCPDGTRWLPGGEMILTLGWPE